MPNTIDSGLQRDVIMESALTAFRKKLAILRLLSYRFMNVPLEGTNKMQVPYYPLATATSKDYSGTYEFDDGTNTSAKEVTINKRKYQSLSFTSEELSRQPNLDPETLGTLRGDKLAEDVLTDIMSVVTASNYGNTDYSAGNYGAASKLTQSYANFDMDDVIDLEAIADTQNWPDMMRGLILPPAYLGNVKKDIAATGGIATFGISSTGQVESFPMINSFNLGKSNIVPSNSESLEGMIVYPSAILVGFAPIPPQGRVADVVDYVAMEDPETGLVLEFREWGVANSDTTYWTVEVNYGYAVGETAALKRIVSA